MAGVARISATDLSLLLQSREEVILLDVRQPEERAFASIPVPADKGDLFIPLGELTARLDEVKSRCGSNTQVVVYCHHGVRSLRAANWLAAQGLANLTNLDGGIDAWSESVDPAIPQYC
jgi:rhodanese-related sulfurtransferase